MIILKETEKLWTFGDVFINQVRLLCATTKQVMETDIAILNEKNSLCGRSFGTRNFSKSIEHLDHVNSNKFNGVKQFVIVGLGNHDMIRTRHSVGMQAVNFFAEKLDATWERKRNLKAFIAAPDIQLGDNFKLCFVKPTYPMNLNGKTVMRVAQALSVDVSSIYLVHDELDKTVGKCSIKNGGSARGHNGVKSCLNSLKDDGITRLLLGIDRPIQKEDVGQYVLSQFDKEELLLMQKTFSTAFELLMKDIQRKFDS